MLLIISIICLQLWMNDAQNIDCKYDDPGTEYRGTLSLTKSGLQCQYWITQEPNRHYTDPNNLPDWDLKEAKNYCRNPDNNPTGPWCWLATGQGNKTCNVPLCDCKDTMQGTKYMGKIQRTKSGVTCQKWTDKAPNAHTISGDGFPEKSPTSTQNFCRNPTGKRNGPWCFLSDSVGWEYCDVPQCECKMTEEGKHYVGKLNTTIMGIPCQPWLDQAPHHHSRNRSLYFPDKSVEEAKNYCRNPDNDGTSPWCYTMELKNRWQICNVPYCRSAVRRPRIKLRKKVIGLYHCQTSKMGLEYKGHISETASKKACQRWDDQSPNKHNQTDITTFPDASMAEANNYCRNPDNSVEGPWCYVAEPSGSREKCNIPKCECKPSVNGSDYTGRLSKTLTGLDCQKWDATSPHDHPQYQDNDFPDQTVTAADNYCRNPQGDKEKGPWCYTTDPQVDWEYCNLELCECKQTQKGKEYMGRVNFTKSGRNCQRWDTSYPHIHFRVTEQKLPDLSVSNAENYCRNPDDEPEGPWCYTTDRETRWEYCQVDFCPNYPKPSYTNTGTKGGCGRNNVHITGVIITGLLFISSIISL